MRNGRENRGRKRTICLNGGLIWSTGRLKYPRFKKRVGKEEKLEKTMLQKKKEYNSLLKSLECVCVSVCELWVPCLSQAHTPPIQCAKLKRKAISISAKVRLATCDEAISFIICFSSLRCHWEAFPCLIPWKCISLHSHPLFAAVAHRSWSSAASGTFTVWNSMRPFL